VYQRGEIRIQRFTIKRPVVAPSPEAGTTPAGVGLSSPPPEPGLERTRV
jgi:hypothetical protein